MPHYTLQSRHAQSTNTNKFNTFVCDCTRGTPVTMAINELIKRLTIGHRSLGHHNKLVVLQQLQIYSLKKNCTILQRNCSGVTRKKENMEIRIFEGDMHKTRIGPIPNLYQSPGHHIPTLLQLVYAYSLLSVSSPEPPTFAISSVKFSSPPPG